MTFKDVFDHKVKLMIMWSTTVQETVTESYLIWAAKHLLAQRVRLENQQGTIHDLGGQMNRQIQTIHNLQKDVRRLENEVGDLNMFIDTEGSGS